MFWCWKKTNGRVFTLNAIIIINTDNNWDILTEKKENNDDTVTIWLLSMPGFWMLRLLPGSSETKRDNKLSTIGKCMSPVSPYSILKQ